MKPLAFSSNAFKRNTLEEAAGAIAGCGYGGIELMADVPHAYPAGIDRAGRKAIKDNIARNGLLVSNINAFTMFACGDTYHPTWLEFDEDRRRKRIKHSRRCIELAAEMECSTVSLQPGGPLIGTGMHRGEAMKRFAAGLEELLPAARGAHVTLAVEPEPGLLIQSAQEYLQFKTTFFPGEKSIRMNCDIGHLFCVRDDPADVIRQMPGEIAHVHLEDIGENRVHQHLTPGKGAIDFDEILTALREIQYRGWVTVELYPYETTAAGVAEAAIRHLTPLLKA
jgi:sugar phosphate isomerase/epimerase